MKHVLGMTAALTLSVLFAPPASAEPDFATVTLTKVSGWSGPAGGVWTARGGTITPQKFALDVKNVAGHDEEGLSVFVSFPTDRLDVTSWSGDGWNCWDVNDGPGAEGIRCTQDHLIVHEEAWPTLTVETRVFSTWTQDSFDVYAEAGGHEEVHAAQNFLIDTST